MAVNGKTVPIRLVTLGFRSSSARTHVSYLVAPGRASGPNRPRASEESHFARVTSEPL